MNLPSRTNAAERVLGSIARGRWRTPDQEAPTRAQVAMVAHALADHTLNVQMVQFSDSPDGVAMNVGRWMHALGDDLDNLVDGLAVPILFAGDFRVGHILDLPYLPDALGSSVSISAPTKASHGQGFSLTITFGDGESRLFTSLVDAFEMAPVPKGRAKSAWAETDVAEARAFGYQVLKIVTEQMRQRIEALLELSPSLLVFGDGKVHVS
ncbi:hypothetical protein GCM10025867_49130 (plasmid) [Frondihabitans sucicola]|uniref:Uncharacterized protein n=1 Tax=Frondihabitans sucicola TaxID=1268041 RepID=A0ABM8GW44_9MICO|nr:hypothetical protein [Frondihabitans sucicola]BDZ52672.1 hypothetical protein GCM10025867_49130 [Frondihabitans sucicola]